MFKGSRTLSRDVLLTLLGTVLGALLGWLVTQVYYVRNLEDMRADAFERQRVEQLILRGIEQVGEIRYARDDAGRITGVAIGLSGGAAAQSSASGDLSVTPAASSPSPTSAVDQLQAVPPNRGSRSP